MNRKYEDGGVTMRIGMCGGFKKDDENNLFIDKLDLFREYGFDYMEMQLANIAQLEDGEFDNLTSLLKEQKIEVPTLNLFISGSIPMTGQNYNEHIFKEYAEKAINRAGSIGVKRIVLGSGGSRNVPYGFSKTEAKRQLVDCIRFAGDICEKNDIILCLEHLHKRESNILETFEETAKLTKELNHPNIKCVLDFFHFNVGNENHDLILEFSDQIAHVHYATTLGRNFPSILGIDEIFETDLIYLKKIGYNDTFSFECSGVGDNPEQDKQVIKKIKDYFV